MSATETAPRTTERTEAQAKDFKDGLIREIPNLRAFAASLSGSMQLADDLVQDTLLKAWGNSDKFEPGTSLRAWLFTILRNTYYSLYRKRGREVQDSEGTYAERMATHGNQESHLDLADFRKALAKLPEEQREVLIMVGATGLSYEEAAEICGVAIGTIKSRVNRARTKLAELLSIGGVDDLGPDRTSAAAMQRVGSEIIGS
ncbi:sigma-70 family RNA polymerase sigma factor [Bosea sp. BH3]|uniref:sigma-70 family RNA polymerase sigma factor n=1 Tax=Bosea sp. BH3 TaxID=2871701 RepID=UPI0021CB1CFA|nr:sigma-70 family RNA polymerase sigma factor [Bosea sp. BH3]MCU4181401.1 sigma-70 family RNA polymerase sigma factor [Bosea sp. BH3]